MLFIIINETLFLYTDNNLFFLYAISSLKHTAHCKKIKKMNEIQK